MEVPEGLRYTEEHEWVKLENGRARVGISDYAQDQLGDVVYVELPGPGTAAQAMESFGVIESVKAASDLFSPLSGEVVAVNDELEMSPELVNEDPFGDGWMIVVEMSDPDELDELLTADEYIAFLEDLEA